MMGFLGPISAETEKVLDKLGHLVRPTSLLQFFSRSRCGLGHLAAHSQSLESFWDDVW